jgi:hypothetical protein
MMMSRYHSKISQKATYLRVYEDNRMLYGEEVTGIIHNLEKRIVELDETLSHCKVFLEEMHYIEVNETIKNSQELHTEVSKQLKDEP